MTRPQLFVLGGPNGAGKSTIAQRFIVGRIPVVNTDDIARAIAPTDFNAIENQIKAGRLAVTERNRLLRERQSFSFETTLTGNSELRLMQQAADAGYKVNLIFVGLDSAGLSAARVDLRVASNGHDVSTEDIFRRYSRCMAALPKALEIAHRAWIFDNSGQRRRLPCSREKGRTKHLAKSLPPWADAAIPKEMRQI